MTSNSRSQYDGTSVYEWNIDGFSEHQILNFISLKHLCTFKVKCVSIFFLEMGQTVKPKPDPDIRFPQKP